ncbi:hypothetical protein [Natrarchaeobius chitinivorans]|uniref:Uncharacterized protein n=1 Tax=Natrarchaeobius chitinivorans TaxID=1679083 RepID=A0A3N6LQR1_NATCH|nr:hypothetical protein [Natrarchaeobius chitinivorans]RQG91978.1 hypothetical protein EA473_18275 [Natrarchaeobius chitinivorans]
MGILDLMLGKSGPGEQGVEGQSYTLPKETHEFVYPVAVRREELEAFDALLEAEADAPSFAEDVDEVQEALDAVLEDHEIDAEELANERRRPRRVAEPVIDHWLDKFGDGADIGVVYALPGTRPALVSFVGLCRRRDQDVDDPFELPESVSRVTSLLARLEEATGSQYRAVVHTDLLAASE